jgi:phenylalanyl-tRNA synthetase beta chain
VYVSADAKYDFEHPVNTFDVMVGGVKVGYISVPHPVVSSNIDKKCAVAFFEIETEKFANIKADNIKYSEPSKFPAIDIDLTFNADVSAVKFNELTDKLKAEIGELLTDVKTKDIYVAEDGSVALTLRFSFVSKERTLSKQELQPDIEKIIAASKLQRKKFITFKYIGNDFEKTVKSAASIASSMKVFSVIKSVSYSVNKEQQICMIKL